MDCLNCDKYNALAEENENILDKYNLVKLEYDRCDNICLWRSIRISKKQRDKTMKILKNIIKNIIFLICAIIVLLLYVPQFIFDSLSDLIETIGKDFEIQAQKIINYIDNI